MRPVCRGFGRLSEADEPVAHSGDIEAEELAREVSAVEPSHGEVTE